MPFSPFFTKNVFFLLIVATSCWFVACKNGPDKPFRMDNYDKVAPQAVDFQLNIVEPDNPEHDAIYTLLQNDDVLQRFINEINKRIEFPGEVAIEIADCDEVNCYYSSEQQKITICYEFIDAAFAMQDDTTLSDSEKLVNAVGFIFLHEMGHALVDKLNLPITGKEESAVDELAMLILMSDTTDATYFAAIEGAMQFYRFSLQQNIKNIAFYDTHAPDMERYYDMLAIIVGATPSVAEQFVGDDDPFKLHSDRAATAEWDYEKKLATWKRLLGNAWKE